MPSKVLVTKEFHRKALVAIEQQKRREALEDDNVEILRMAWMSYIETHFPPEKVDHFCQYVEDYVKELGVELK